jgi:putative DNA primase/helicase
MADNYDDVLRQMTAYGLEFGPKDLPLVVGKIARVAMAGDREKRGWYLLHEFRPDDGGTLLVGSFGYWRGNENNAVKVEIGKREFSPEQREALRAKLDADRKAAEAARKKDNARAAQLARLLWKAAAGEGACAYLGRKQIKPHGARFTGDGLTITCGEQDHRSIDGGQLVVPMCDVSGQVHGVQLVRGEKKNCRDKDFWPAGLAKKGHFHIVGASNAAGSVILVAEGYATAASIHEATGLPVAVAFDAGNLAPVAEVLKKRYPRAAFIIAADDDYLTEGNPGKTSASAAALKVGGTWLAPTFAEDRAGQKITDFNDLAESAQYNFSTSI